ncbi:MAG: LptA/OstA family protein [Nitrospirota bacterium]
MTRHLHRRLAPLAVWSAIALSAWLRLAGAEEARTGEAGPPLPTLVQPLAAPAGPMTITSDRMMIHEAEQRATFEGRVMVQQGDLTVRADRLDVWVNGSAASLGPAYGSGNITSIKASGHVEVVHQDRRARADEATYDQAKQQIELVGNLTGMEGGYQIAGTRMVIYLQERRSVIEGSRVVIPPGFASPQGDTVKPGAESARRPGGS